MSRDLTLPERLFGPKTIFGIFAGAGILHLVAPKMWIAMVPPRLPAKKELVYASGVAEIIGAAGYAYKPTRPLAARYLVALLIAVFPSNINMAVDPKFARGSSALRAGMWGRLPIQFLGMWWVRELSKRTV